MPTLEDKVMQDLKEAMKSNDEVKMRTIRAIKSAILLEKTSEKGGELTPETELKMLNKLAKQRQDALDIYRKEGREDLAEKEEQELIIIKTYLPEQLSEEEITSKINEIIEQTGAQGVKDMGKVMGIASKELIGKADGKTISTIVKKQLNT